MSETNGYVLPDAIFSTPLKREFIDKDIPGLGKFRIRNLLTSEVVELEAKTSSKNGRKTALAKIVAAHCVDGEGNLLFSSEDVPRLMDLPASQVLPLANACSQHSGIADTEDEEKN